MTSHISQKKTSLVIIYGHIRHRIFLSRVNIGYPLIIERCPKILLMMSLTFVLIATQYINFQCLKYYTAD
jgi:hypothetical protein